MNFDLLIWKEQRADVDALIGADVDAEVRPMVRPTQDRRCPAKAKGRLRGNQTAAPSHRGNASEWQPCFRAGGKLAAGRTAPTLVERIARIVERKCRANRPANLRVNQRAMRVAKPRRALFLLPVAYSLLPLTGCAKSPSGGPVNQTPNRLQVTLNIQGNLASNAYYAVAFDDDSTRRGPIAITSGSSANDAVIPLNGVVGGSFRVMVLYNNNNFMVFRRPDPNSPNVEIIERANTPFVGGLSPRATTNSINFTLNLDARAGDGSFYFSHDANGVLSANVLNLNAFATTRPFINARDLRIKPVDALGQSTTSTPEQFLIGGTRIASINDYFGDNNDRNNYDSSFNNTTDPDYVNFRQLDISSLNLNVTRSN